MYHSGLLFKQTEGDTGAQHNKTIKSHPNKHNGARPQVGSDNKTHVESFDTGFGLIMRISIWELFRTKAAKTTVVPHRMF